jgi:hypothetical protein
MRTLQISESNGDIGLATKLRDEATAWRKSRPARATVSMAGIQVVRIQKRRHPGTAASARPRVAPDCAV